MSGLAYFGYVRRVHRAGAYLRALEREVALRAENMRAQVRWQTFLASDLVGAGRILSPQVVVAMLYCGSILVSGLAFAVGAADYARAWGAAFTGLGLLPGNGATSSAVIATLTVFGLGVVAATLTLGTEAHKVTRLAEIMVPYADLSPASLGG